MHSIGATRWLILLHTQDVQSTADVYGLPTTVQLRGHRMSGDLCSIPRPLICTYLGTLV